MRCPLGCLFLMSLLVPPAVQAQTGFIENPDYDGVALEVLHPSYPDRGFDEPRHVVGFLTAQVPLPGSPDRIVVEIPVSYYDPRLQYGERRATGAMGNPYIGIRSERMEVGVRLPLTEYGNDHLRSGYLDVHRLEAFRPRMISVVTLMGTGWRVERLRVQVQAGPAFRASFRQQGNAFLDVLSGVQVRYEGERIGFGGAIAGRVATQGIADDFPEPLWRGLTQQVELAMSYRLGRLRPGLDVRAPMHGQYNHASVWSVSLRAEL